MLLTNDPAGRWVNGSLGRVAGHRHEDGTRLVMVEVRGGDVVDVEHEGVDVDHSLGDAVSSGREGGGRPRV